ncbi:protein SprT [Luminiphilus syltensis NOR5-1B]|uniref:Protein SprT n=1 Tax=Luminiphilus syltensis NOR5-1B TaxID=565045 RepID=B8KQZ1_9GAMM|nr:SprT-like domain-containing protein [Luminiphilus syltensis]EED35255.1 protein SprT [Luminiphilus syltensis NOR5-1B]
MNRYIEPINDEQRQDVDARTQRAVATASLILQVNLPAITVRFDLRGSAAGMFCARSGERWIRFNPWLFAKDWQRHASDTVLHEVAHYGVHMAYPPRSVRAHGPEWRSLVSQLGGSPAATFDDNLEGVPTRRQRRHRYHCGCQTHWLSSTRHNRVLRRKATYHCVQCGRRLTGPVD